MRQRQEIEDLIANHRISEALEVFMQLELTETARAEAILLKSRWRKNEQGRRTGTVSNREELLEANRITFAFIELLTAYEGEQGARPVYKPAAVTVADGTAGRAYRLSAEQWASITEHDSKPALLKIFISPSNLLPLLVCLVFIYVSYKYITTLQFGKNDWLAYLYGNYPAILATAAFGAGALLFFSQRMRGMFNRYIAKKNRVNPVELNYLLSLMRDLKQKNAVTNPFYINTEGVLLDSQLLKIDARGYPDIRQHYYTITALKENVKEQDFNNLSNIEKIDSSRGRSFTRLEDAVRVSAERSNVCVIIAPPGSGKTVSLRNFAIKQAERRMEQISGVVPVFINLAYYSKLVNGRIQPFEQFLEEYFSTNKYCYFLANGRWAQLLQQGKLIFFLDSIDEMPRKPGEYEERCRQLNQFTATYPNTQFILSCRELDYNRELPFQQILIKPFSGRQIRQYLIKYFDRSKGGQYFRLIRRQKTLFEIAKNPFYLHLISVYIEEVGKMPQNKADIFMVFTELTVKRELAKKHLTEAEVPGFFTDVTELAYYMAVTTMNTTIEAEAFLAEKNEAVERYRQSLITAARAGLIDYDSKTGVIKFIHNRFQEYFSSLFLLKNYKNKGFSLPENFFINIWWRETILLIASLEENIDDFIARLLGQIRLIDDRDSYVNYFLKLKGYTLAFECLLQNARPATESAYYRELYDALLGYYEKGDPLTRAKVLTALEHDRSDQTLRILYAAMDDKSHWVSERAFYILTAGTFKLQLRMDNILREYWRFFIQGRMLGVIGPVVRQAARSAKLAITLPLFFTFALANLLFIALILYVIYVFVDHIIYRLNSSFDSECVRCIITALVNLAIIAVGFLINKHHPVLTRVIFLTPLVIIQYYLFTYGGDASLNRTLLTMFFGVPVLYVYDKLYKKPKEIPFVPYILIGLGALAVSSLLISIFNIKDLSIDFVDVAKLGRLFTLVTLFIGSAAILGLFVLLINEIRFYVLTHRVRKALQTLLTSPLLFPLRLAWQVGGALQGIQLNWSKKLLLTYVMAELTKNPAVSREFKIYFLFHLAEMTKDVDMKDAVCQLLEEEEKNFSRSIASTNVLAGGAAIVHSAASENAITGRWIIAGNYSERSVQGSVEIQREDHRYGGQMTLLDTSAKGPGYTVVEQVEVEVFGDEVLIEGVSVELKADFLVRYHLDRWIGRFEQPDRITGMSLDDAGTSGTFTMERVVA